MRHYATSLIAVLFVLSLVPAAFAAPMSYDEKYDIMELMIVAEGAFDFDEEDRHSPDEDAVVLLDKLVVDWLEDGRRRLTRHQIVWISSEYGIDAYADLRVPYDHERCTFETLSLRTWRENQWWEDPGTNTGVEGVYTSRVETLPYAVATAYDYQHMREMMLLHDGVELPCIMETAYVIEDKEPFRKGVDGLWYFTADDPVAKSVFSYSAPRSVKVRFDALGIEEPKQDLREDILRYTWTAGPNMELGHPHMADMATSEPYVAWSSWASWQAFGDYLSDTMTGAMTLEQDLKDSVATLIQYEPNAVAKASAIAAFVDRNTRSVHYDWRYWLEHPRKAQQTYETAYGHALDRAVLAGALFQQAGLEVFPMFRSKTCTDVNGKAPTVSRMDAPGLWVSGKGLEAYFDATHGTLSNGLSPIFGRSVWLPSRDANPEVRWSGKGEENALTVTLPLEFSHDSNMWYGDGYFAANGGLCPYDKMEGMDGEAADYLGKVVGGVLDGGEAEDFSPVSFDRFGVEAGFKFKAPVADVDEFGRIPLHIGQPKGGIVDRLPADVHLYDESRQSMVFLPGDLTQTVQVRLEPGHGEVVYKPEDKVIDNLAGKFTVTSAREGDLLVITRTLQLRQNNFIAEEWSALRELLLVETDEANGLVLLKF